MSGPPPLFSGFGKPQENKDGTAANNSASGSTPQPTTSNALSGFSFGNTGATNANASTNNGGTNIFGNKPSSSEPSKASPFSLGSVGAPAPAPSPSLFGGQPSGQTTNTLFAGVSAPTPSATPPTGGGLFANFGKPATPGGGGGLFGGAKPAENASTTPAGTPQPDRPPVAAAPLFSGFGTTPKPADAPKPPPLFGATSAAPPPAMSAPAPFNLFNKPSESAGGTTAAKPSLFFAGATTSAPGATGDPQKAATPTPTSSTPQTAPPLFGGGLFNKTQQPANNNEATTAQKAQPNLFAALGTGTSSTTPEAGKDTTKDSSKVSGAPTSAPSLFGNALKKPESVNVAKENTSGSAPQPQPPAFNLFNKKPEDPKPTDAKAANPTKTDTAQLGTTSAVPAGSAPAPSAPAPAPVVTPTPPSMLRGKSIEEIVSKWEKDLQTAIEEFNRIAGEVEEWDKVLIENGNYVSQLHNQVMNAEATQQLVDHTLTSIEAQQSELGTTLEMYEKQASDLLDGASGNLRALDTGPADAERDRNYTLGAELSVSLDDLMKSLSQMVTSVNDLSIAGGGEATDRADPLTQIAEVLNEHLASLNWIDNAVTEMEGRMKTIETRLTGANQEANGMQQHGHGNMRRSFQVR